MSNFYLFYLGILVWGLSAQGHLRNLKGESVPLDYQQPKTKTIFVQSSCHDCLEWLDSLESCHSFLRSHWVLISLDPWSKAKKVYQSKSYADWILVSDSALLKNRLKGTPTLQINNTFHHTKLNCSQFITEGKINR